VTESLVRAQFKRPSEGAHWAPADGLSGLEGGIGWQSNGGYDRRHPHRGLPFSVEAKAPEGLGGVNRVVLAGVFALHGGPGSEPPGALGASLHLRRNGEDLHRISLVQGRHYGDADASLQVFRPNGDGTSIETVGLTEVEGEQRRVDILTWETPPGPAPDAVLFRDLGTPASFVLFDIAFGCEAAIEQEVGPVCGALGRSLRLRDRRGYLAAFNRIEAELAELSPADAKGRAALIVAAAASAVEEMEPGRIPAALLANAWDSIRAEDDIAEACRAGVQLAVRGYFPSRTSPTEGIIERAIAYVERHSSQPLTDEIVADRFGLSTSHFRHLFKQVTRQPFHRYLLSVRLERAREELLNGEQKVSAIASRLGFASPAHFSRVFVQKFGVTPSALRTGGRRD
jgi:AraC-like DNA-binding protein